MCPCIFWNSVTEQPVGQMQTHWYWEWALNGLAKVHSPFLPPGVPRWLLRTENRWDCTNLKLELESGYVWTISLVHLQMRKVSWFKCHHSFNCPLSLGFSYDFTLGDYVGFGAWECHKAMIFTTDVLVHSVCNYDFVFHEWLAFQLKRCPPPPTVPQADLLAEDEDFEIGKTSSVTWHGILSFYTHLLWQWDSDWRMGNLSANNYPKTLLGPVQRSQVKKKMVFCVHFCNFYLFCHFNFALVILSIFFPSMTLLVLLFWTKFFTGRLQQIHGLIRDQF
jgi:hypothetical protein